MSDSLDAADMGHSVEGEADLAAPGVLDLHITQLRVHANHSGIEPVASPGDSGGREAGAAPEEHPVVGAQPPVIEEVLGVEQHAAVWDRAIGEVGGQGLGRDDIAAEGNDATSQRR